MSDKALAGLEELMDAAIRSLGEHTNLIETLQVYTQLKELEI